jgi:hypothetical protein
MVRLASEAMPRHRSSLASEDFADRKIGDRRVHVRNEVQAAWTHALSPRDNERTEQRARDRTLASAILVN